MNERWSPDIVGLLHEPAPAVLTTYRRDGSASVSPVWFRLHQHSVEVVIAQGDAKLRQLDRDPRCSLVVFETRPPFRGVRVEGIARLGPDIDSKARLDIASRYLGPDQGRRFVEQRSSPGLILRIERSTISEWDLAAILPENGAPVR